MTNLPEHPLRWNELPLFPRGVIGCKIGQKSNDKIFRRMHFVCCPDRICEPCTIIPWLRTRCLEPIATVISGISGISEPANLIELMTGGAGYRTIRPGPEWAVYKFRETVAAVWGAVCEMLRNKLPAVVPCRGDLRVRTLEEGNVTLIPFEITIVPESLMSECGIFVNDRSDLTLRLSRLQNSQR